MIQDFCLDRNTLKFPLSLKPKRNSGHLQIFKSQKYVPQHSDSVFVYPARKTRSQKKESWFSISSVWPLRKKTKQKIFARKIKPPPHRTTKQFDIIEQCIASSLWSSPSKQTERVSDKTKRYRDRENTLLSYERGGRRPKCPSPSWPPSFRKCSSIAGTCSPPATSTSLSFSPETAVLEADQSFSLENAAAGGGDNEPTLPCVLVTTYNCLRYIQQVIGNLG